MTDILDAAKQLEMQQRDDALQSQLQNAKPKERPLVIDGVRCCIDCEDEIIKKRLDAQPDVVRCVYCQDRYEIKQKQYRKL